MLKTWRSSSSLDFLQYIKYFGIASGIKLIKDLHLHRQFAISSDIGSRGLCSRPKWNLGNRRIAEGMLAGEFGKPWYFLAEMPAHARGGAARGAGSSSNQIWWCLY